MDIIVTTPKSEILTAAKEAEEAIAADGYYFRWFGKRPNIAVGEKVFYIEDGFIRGYGLVQLDRKVRNANIKRLQGVSTNVDL